LINRVRRRKTLRGRKKECRQENKRKRLKPVWTAAEIYTSTKSDESDQCAHRSLWIARHFLIGASLNRMGLFCGFGTCGWIWKLLRTESFPLLNYQALRHTHLVR
jgi:hypothetical protein